MTTVPDKGERAKFNADATRDVFGSYVRMASGRNGFVVAVDVRDQFGLGDDVWLVQDESDPTVVTAEAATSCQPLDEGVE